VQADLADDLGVVAFVLLVVVFVVGLGSSVAPSAPRWLNGALAAALVAETVWLVLLAAGRDTYFDPEHVTRWEFAGRDGNQWFVVLAIVAAAVTTVGLVAAFVTQKRWIRRAASAATTIVCVLILVASFVLTVGH
jgi:hypothetical protein